MLETALCLARLEAATAEAVIRHLARELHRGGHVAASFEAAAVAREGSPTGLPFAGGAVAIPHAEPEHVVVRARHRDARRPGEVPGDGLAGDAVHEVASS